MKANALKLNEDITECIIFSMGKDPVYMTLLAERQTVKSQDTVKVLGVILDSKMTLNQQYMYLLYMYMYMYLFVSYMPYSRISQIKKVFNLANAIQRHF